MLCDRFFDQPLPGRIGPPGASGGASAVGPLGADTEFVTNHEVH